MDRLPMAAVRFASQLALSAAVTGFCLSGTLVHAAKSTKQPAQPTATVPKSPESVPALPAAPVSKTPARLVFADPYPSPPEPITPDLLLNAAGETQNEALVFFTLGSLAEEQGEAEAAFGFFQKSLNLAPGNVPLAIQLATYYVQRQENAEALRILKDAQQARPTHPAPLIEIARLYLTALHQPDNALAYAEKAYKLAPEQFPAISIFVEVCSAAKLSQKVDDALRRTDLLGSQDSNFWLQAGDLFRNAYALRSPAPPRPTVDRLNGLFRKALDLAPRDVRCLERVADHYSLSRQFAEACSLYERAHALFREQNQASSPSICQKWARALALSEHVNLAIDLLEELIHEQPMIASARELAGELYLQQGQLISALGHLRFALETDPSEQNEHIRVIQLQLRLRRSAEAAQTAQAARQLFPDSATLTMLLAVALSESKNPAEAVKSFELAEHQFLASQKEALDAGFYLTYGAAAERAGLLDKAAALLQKSIAIDPSNAAEALNYLGYMWIDRNQHLEEAGELIQKALTLRPNHPAYLDSLGWWYYRKGDFAAAEQELRKALEHIRREDSGEVYEHLGDVLENLEHPEDALAAWEAALEMDANLVGIKEKIARVRSATPPQPAP